MVRRRLAYSSALFPRLLLLLGCLILAPLRAEIETGEPVDGALALAAGNHAKAFDLLSNEARNGDARSQFLLSTLYLDGKGVARDQAAAIRWLYQAAEGGFAPAQFNLGNFYFQGSGLDEDPAKGIEWWRKAADQGFYQAQFNLGIALLRGVGVPPDRDEAILWFEKAAAGGSEPAREILAKLGAAEGTPETRQLPEPAVSPRSRPEPPPVAAPERPAEEPKPTQKLSRQPRQAPSLPPIPRVQPPPPVAVPAVDPDPVIPQPEAGRGIATNPTIVQPLPPDPEFDPLPIDAMRPVVEEQGAVASEDDVPEEAGAMPWPDSRSPAAEVERESVKELQVPPMSRPAPKPEAVVRPPARQIRKEERSAPDGPVSVAPETTRDEPSMPGPQAPPKKRMTSQAGHESTRAAVHPATWIGQQPAGNFTIQINGYADAGEAARVARELIAERVSGEVAIFRYRRDGELWHTVILGSYAERGAAEQARVGLKLERWSSPGWVRDFRSIQRIMMDGR